MYTIFFGFSAGGVIGSSLLTIPAAKGLFPKSNH
jgi:carboxylesterase type B